MLREILQLCSYNQYLDILKLHTLFVRRRFECIFKTYSDFIDCPSLLEAVGIRVSVRKFEVLILSIIRFHVRNSM
jgi:hypothetical protein